MKIEPLNNKELFILCDLLKLPIVQIDRKDRMQFKHDGCYIINLQSWNEGGGSHWTVLYRKVKRIFTLIHSELLHHMIFFNNYIIKTYVILMIKYRTLNQQHADIFV